MGRMLRPGMSRAGAAAFKGRDGILTRPRPLKPPRSDRARLGPVGAAMGSLGRCLARSLPRGQPGLSPPAPRCYGSGETRPVPVLPLGTLSPPSSYPCPHLRPAPGDPLLIPVPSPVPRLCRPSELPFPRCPLGVPSPRSVPGPPVLGGWRLTGSCHPFVDRVNARSCCPQPRVPAWDTARSWQSLKVLRAVLGGPWCGGQGQGRALAEPSRAQQCPGELTGSVCPALSPPAPGPPGPAARDGSPKGSAVKCPLPSSSLPVPSPPSCPLCPSSGRDALSPGAAVPSCDAAAAGPAAG